MTTETDYRTEIVELRGYLAAEEVGVVHMPRQEFLRLLERCIDLVEPEGYDDVETEDLARVELHAKLRAELLPVARTMPRFPLGQWMDGHRGCGCVVGEYLVASGAVDRAVAAQRQLLDDGVLDLTVEEIDALGESLRVDRELDKMGDWGIALYAFGINIDGMVRRAIDQHTPSGTMWDLAWRNNESNLERDVVVVFEDEI